MNQNSGEAESKGYEERYEPDPSRDEAVDGPEHGRPQPAAGRVAVP
jgi:hypothetical protein